jgi:peptide/nickel transport system substrate-binding protein
MRLVPTVKHAVIASVAVAACLLGLSGCTPTSLVVDGSTVTVASSQAFTSFNDATSFGNTASNSEIVGLVNSGFVYYDETSTLVRDESFGTAEVVTVDPFTVRYTVNEDVTWSDGEPVDGADLLLAWAANSGQLNTEGFSPLRFVDEQTGLFEPFPDGTVYFDGEKHSGLQYVSAMPTLGDDGRSIELVYDGYFVDWLLAFDVGLPAHVLGLQAFTVTASEDESAAVKAKSLIIEAITSRSVEQLSAISQLWNSEFVVGGTAPMIGSGPYSIHEVVPNESVTLRVNPLYSGERQPRYETIVVRTISDPLAAVRALQAGEVDVIAPTPNADVLSAIRAVDGIQLIEGTSGMWEHLDLQFDRAKHATFQNPLLREAFLATVPVAELVAQAGGVVRTSLVLPPAGDETAPEPDIAKAKRLIEQAGATGPIVCILFDPSNPRRLAEFELIKASAQQAGFVVTNCSSSDWQGFLGVPGAYDAALFAWDESTAAASAPEARLLSSSTLSNYSYYASDEVDALLAELAVEPDLEAQRVLLERIDTQLAEDFYGLALYQFPAIVAHSPSVTGLAPGPIAGLLWNAWQWQPAETAG